MTESKAAAGARTKLNVEIRTLEENAQFSGIFVGRTTTPWTDKKDGQTKDLTTVVFKELTSEARFGIFQDAGLKRVLDDAMVEPGMKLEIHKLEKKELDGGRTVNQYDIYRLA